MITIATFGRMVFAAPFQGLAAIALSALWMVPLAALAGQVAGGWTFGPLDDAARGGLDALVGAFGFEDALPPWVAPASWAPVAGAALVWAFIAQREGMRRAGLGVAQTRLLGRFSGFGEWAAFSVALPLAGLVTLFGGALLAGVHEVSWPFSPWRLPSVPERLGAPVAGGEAFALGVYAGPALFVMLPLVALFAAAGRLMALQAARVDGAALGKSGMPRALVAVGVLHVLATTALVGGLGWVAREIAGSPLAVWQGIAIQSVLLWCSLSVAAAQAAEGEVRHSLEEIAAQRENIDESGPAPTERIGADDDLARRLRAWTARRAA